MSILRWPSTLACSTDPALWLFTSNLNRAWLMALLLSSIWSRHTDEKQSHRGWREPELRAVLWDRKVALAAGAGKGLKFMFLQWTQTSSYSPCSPYTCSFPIPHIPRLLPFYKSLLLYTFADSSWIQVSAGEERVPHSDICPHPVRGIMKQILALLKLGGNLG